MSFEYIAVPAPARGEKNRNIKSSGERFASTLSAELNRMAAGGWEFLRSEVLPSEERSGLSGRTVTYHNLLIFRRPLTTGKAAGTGIKQRSGASATSTAQTD